MPREPLSILTTTGLLLEPHYQPHVNDNVELVSQQRQFLWIAPRTVRLPSKRRRQPGLTNITLNCFNICYLFCMYFPFYRPLILIQVFTDTVPSVCADDLPCIDTSRFLVTFTLNLVHQVCTFCRGITLQSFMCSQIPVPAVSAHNLPCITALRFSGYFHLKGRPPSYFPVCIFPGGITLCSFMCSQIPCPPSAATISLVLIH